MNDIRALDNISFSEWFISKGGTRGSIQRMWDPIAYALGFIDCDNMSARCMLTIFQLFAARSEASVLRMLEGSPDKFLTGPIVKYIEQRGATLNLRRAVREVAYETDENGRTRITGLVVSKGSDTELVQADYYVAACDVAGAKRLIPAEWRDRYDQFQKLYQLESVPVVTVQLRFDGWVTELQDSEKRMRVGDGQAHGINNLLYSADADFSCFADLALTSPTDYYKEGEGSLMQVVLTPGDPYIPKPEAEIVAAVLEQLRDLFPSARDLKCTWSSVVKLPESLYREEPGKDVYRPSQKTAVDNFFLAGSYTYQDYIDSMEGAVKSGKLAATAVLETVAAAGKAGSPN
ncbi:zeta-carotene desaturase [Gracilaria domingensis]|nr:zeta-carotene desaturase [Gracilaria domingensis]